VALATVHGEKVLAEMAQQFGVHVNHNAHRRSLLFEGAANHRGVKSRIGPMLGFKIFKWAAVTISGVELLHRIRWVPGQAAAAIWTAALSA
jgi:transposase-like protein